MDQPELEGTTPPSASTPADPTAALHDTTSHDTTSHDTASHDTAGHDTVVDTQVGAEPGDDTDGGLDGTERLDDPTVSTGPKKRRRGSRGGKNRKRPATGTGQSGDAADDGTDLDDDGDDDGDDDTADDDTADDDTADDTADDDTADDSAVGVVDGRLSDDHPELPERISEGRPSAAAADAALVRRPQIGDTRPAPAAAPPGPAVVSSADGNGSNGQNGQGTQNGQRNRAKGKSGSAGASGRGGAAAAGAQGGRLPADPAERDDSIAGESEAARKKRRRGGRGRTGGAGPRPDTALPEMDPDVLERRRGRERNGRPIGRYLMCVQVRPNLTQVAVLEGRTLIEHYVSRPADDVSQIHGNIYVGKVQNVLPGMEAAFVDIGTPKNAVLYRGDVQYDAEDIVEKNKEPRIEQMLRSKQLIVCQVTKNPIGAKGARLTQEVSLPGRFVVLIPHSKTYGISKRLPDDVRKRLRNILDRVKPAEHGLIVRTAAEHATEHELRADMTRLLDQWNAIEAKAKKVQTPTLLYREPELAVRVIREEFNAEYRGVVIDDHRLHDDVKDYVGAFNPELADRVEFYDAAEEGLPMYERFHIHEQLHKALDRKVWLPSGGSLIIEHTEALTVIDVNTGKNVGTTNLEETVFRNNLEAAEEVAKQLRLRDIGGIVVIDFIDMEIKDNRKKVVEAFRGALSRDKTRTQVFDITELGLVEMTRKRIGEGLLVNFADRCPNCEGRGLVIDHAMLE
jgi:ribonuclease E